MRVWIVNPFDNLPDEGCRPQRYWLMARAFVRAGHGVVLWTQDWSHARKARREVRRDSGEGFEVRGVHVPGYGRNVCLRRVWSHWRFAARWLAEALREEEAPDLVVVSSPPLLAARAVRAFCARRGAEYVVDIMDAWPETFERVVPRWALGWARAVAGRNYRGAARVTAVARRYLDLARGYGAKAPMLLCHHGIDLGRGGALRAARPARPADGAVRVAYVGNMSLSYDLSTAIDAVASDGGLSLDLAGAGPDEPALRARAAGCGRIRFHGYLGDEALRLMLSEADVGLVPMFDESCVGVPYKLADYAAAGLPVASSLHGETEEMLRRFSAGATYRAGDAEALRRAVRRAAGCGEGARALAGTFDAPSLYRGYVDFVMGRAHA